MDGEGSITRWLGPLQGGDPAAAHELWQRYFRSLVELARRRLQHRPLALADEEDVALSAFDSFCRSAGAGRFPDLADRDSLWRLLAVITARKAARLLRDAGRQKRNRPTAGVGGTDLLEQLVSDEPAADLAAQLSEEYERLLDLLGDEQLRQVAVWRMEGYTVEEIAARAGCAPRSVKRKLQLIRTLWQSEAPP